MARLAMKDRRKVESESEDEFPDLKDLLAENGSMRTREMRGGRGGDEKNDEENVGERKDLMEMSGKEGSKERITKTVVKKRVLNSKSDNPLLRPLSRSQTPSFETGMDEAPKTRTRGLKKKVEKGSGRKKGSEDVGQVMEVDEREVDEGLEVKEVKSRVLKGKMGEEATVRRRKLEPEHEPEAVDEVVDERRVSEVPSITTRDEMPKVKSKVSKGKTPKESTVRKRKPEPEPEHEQVDSDEGVNAEKDEGPKSKSTASRAKKPGERAIIRKKIVTRESESVDGGSDEESKNEPSKVKSKTLKGKQLKEVPSTQRKLPSPSFDHEDSDQGANTSEVLQRPPTTKRTTRAPAKKILSSRRARSETPQLDTEDDGGDLSDFIVNDSSICEYEEESIVEEVVPPPKSVRKLVRGRRPMVEESEDEGLGLGLEKEMGKLRVSENEEVEDDPFATVRKPVGGKKLLVGDSEDEDEDDPFATVKKPIVPKDMKTWGGLNLGIRLSPIKKVTGKEMGVKTLNGNDLGLELEKLLLDDYDEDDPFASPRKLSLPKGEKDLDLPSKSIPTKKSKIPEKESAKHSGKEKENQLVLPTGSPDLENPFTLRFSPSQNSPRKVSKEARFVTPPSSPESKPKHKGLVSPKKLHKPIPDTPHRPTTDDFWRQDVINDWNEEYSPKKTLKSRPLLSDPELSEGGLLFSPKKNSKQSPIKPDKLLKEAKKAFSLKKHSLAESFLQELDTKITNGQVSKMASETGGIKIIWSKKLNTTAGRANWKRETIKPHSPSHPPTHRHHAAIELAEKVIDDEDRLLNVVAHEFCHLATFMISNQKTNPHGKEFKVWAKKCGEIFGERGVEVTTKHSYQIDYKYVWECENCGLEFKRHSKSIDPKRHQCGSCKCRLVQTKPVPRKEGEGKGGGLGDYQTFVRENMGRVREENPGSPQKEIMGLVGKRYQEEKARKLAATSKTNEKRGESVSVDEVVDLSKSEEEDDDHGIADVARKLVFLDLTSP